MHVAELKLAETCRMDRRRTALKVAGVAAAIAVAGAAAWRRVAVVAYTVHEDLTVDGKPVTLDAADASTWVRRNGRWVCAMHSESIKGDPFGRDRRPA